MFWKRLLFSYVFVILFALLFLGLIVFNQINTTLKDQVIYSNEIILENGSTIFSNFILDMKALALDITVNDDIQTNLSRFNKKEELYISGKIDQIIARDKYLSKQLDQNNTTCKIYPIKNNTLFVFDEYTGAYLRLKKDDSNLHIFNSLDKNGGFIITSNYLDTGNYILLTCIIYDVSNWNSKNNANEIYKPIGVLELKISATAVSNLLYNIKLEKNISPYIIDDTGQVFLPYVDYKKLDPTIILNYSEEPVYGESEIILKRNILGTKWKIVGILPFNDINEKIEGVSRSFIYTGILTIIILVLLSIYLANWLSNPLKRLARRLKQVEIGEFKPLVVRKSYSTEVKILYEQYNIMSKRIDNLIKQVYEAAEKEKEAELLALQAQINPHFLYNTLDAINWMALKYKAEDVRFMVNSLANMMRYSLNSGKNFISIRDEIEQVRSYVGIQEVRYNGKFKTYFEIDDDILDYKIIKLLLQPLVENAILHGFKDTGKYGDILIKGYIRDKNLVIEVVNEGDKLDMEKIKSILHPENDRKPKNYGIRNVNDRLIKQYGEKFELKFFTKQGRTYAKIEVPLEQIDKGEENE
ncbi:MAG: histidine kinase [Clostridia bacterium]|nr:histidine kinase [Clostridia bacterium]